MTGIPLTIVAGPASSGKTEQVRALVGVHTDIALINNAAPLSAADPLAQMAGYVDASSACMCCVGAVQMRVVMARLLRQRAWREIIVEASAAAKPEQLTDALLAPPWPDYCNLTQLIGPLPWSAPVQGQIRWPNSFRFRRPALRSTLEQLIRTELSASSPNTLISGTGVFRTERAWYQVRWSCTQNVELTVEWFETSQRRANWVELIGAIALDAAKIQTWQEMLSTALESVAAVP
jgi:CobW/HypB/UreG, nucleotide-binding domain